MMIIFAEFFVVILKVLWAIVTAGSKWVVRPKEKSVAGQVCVITGAGSGLGRLFAKEFARRRAILVLWDINSQSNEETAEMVRQIYHELDTPITKDGKTAFFLPSFPLQFGCHRVLRTARFREVTFGFGSGSGEYLRDRSCGGTEGRATQ